MSLYLLYKYVSFIFTKRDSNDPVIGLVLLLRYDSVALYDPPAQ